VERGSIAEGAPTADCVRKPQNRRVEIVLRVTSPIDRSANRARPDGWTMRHANLK